MRLTTAIHYSFFFFFLIFQFFFNHISFHNMQEHVTAYKIENGRWGRKTTPRHSNSWNRSTEMPDGEGSFNRRLFERERMVSFLEPTSWLSPFSLTLHINIVPGQFSPVVVMAYLSVCQCIFRPISDLYRSSAHISVLLTSLLQYLPRYISFTSCSSL